MITPKGLEPTKEGIFALEVVAFFTLILAFTITEIAHIFRSIIQSWPKKTRTTSHHITFGIREVAIILISLAGSMAIYISSVKLLGL